MSTLVAVFPEGSLEGSNDKVTVTGRAKQGRAAADRLVNYVGERREMIRYPQFQAKGWKIGSGPTEAT